MADRSVDGRYLMILIVIGYVFLLTFILIIMSGLKRARDHEEAQRRKELRD